MERFIPLEMELRSTGLDFEVPFEVASYEDAQAAIEFLTKDQATIIGLFDRYEDTDVFFH